MLTGALILGAFVLGSIPTGVLIARARNVDIRTHGSGNIGATNVGRVLGRRWGVLCFALDWLKGFVPAMTSGWALGTLGRLDVPESDAWAWLAVAVAAIAGHMFPPWLGFRGGKGVATGFGALVGVWPALGVPVLCAAVVWAATLGLTRFVGFSSCAAALSVPVWVALLLPGARWTGWSGVDAGARGWPLWPFFTVACLLAGSVVFKHRGNLARMRAGTEPRIGDSRPAPTRP